MKEVLMLQDTWPRTVQLNYIVRYVGQISGVTEI
jgi:hypothetical protein